MDTEPTREQVDHLAGATVVEFGASWCGHCQRARPLIDEALAGHPTLRHIVVEDGRGKPLGRSFGVKLWPTFVVLRDGVEVARVVRPRTATEVQAAFDKLLA
jgi:thioredoxin 1